MIKHIEVTNRFGETLRGYLTIPENFSGLLVLMYHGFTGNKTEHGGLFRDFSRLLEINQIASLRMDFSGNGESDGSFPDFTFDSLFEEAYLLLNVAKRINGVKKVSLLGFSMGGAVASIISSKHGDEINSLLLWSPAGNIIEKIRSLFENSPKLENGNANIPNFELSKAMYESLQKYKTYDNLALFQKEVFIVHGKKDIAVNIEYGIKYQTAFPNAKIHIIESAGHGYDRKEEKEELFNKSLDFLKR